MGRIFLCQNVFLTSPFEFFSRIFRHLATWPWERSAAHSTQWQDLELHLQHGAREGKGLRMRVWDHRKPCCARVWDPRKQHVSVYETNANTLQLIVAAIERFVWHAYAARFRLLQTRKTLCALRTYTQTVLSVFFVHGNSDTRACLRRWWNTFYFDGRPL